jgi:hypothetical protein
MKRNTKMMIGLAIGAVVVIAGLLYYFTRVSVGQSRLALRKEGLHFPEVSGYNLMRDEFEFPRDFAGELNLVIVPFQQWQQRDVNTWIPAAQEIERAYGVIYYELPTIYELPTLSRTFINEGMRAGIPDQTSRERTITLYLDKAVFKEALQIETEEVIHLFLVDRQGEVLWNAQGRFSEDKAGELVAVLKGYR